jgi:mono/diheme cytochrome c family protein
MFAAILLVMAGAVAWAQAPQRPAALATPAKTAPMYTEAQARRGEALYKENCAFCHGPALAGTDYAPPLTAAILGAKWGGRPLSELFDYQQVFMPWNSPGGFSRGQNADMLAYILQRANVPPGDRELPAESKAQQELKFPALR